MDPTLHFITLSTADLEASRAFYVNGLGWQPMLDVPGEIIFFQVAPGLVLGLFDATKFARDQGELAPLDGVQGVTLSHNVDTTDAVETTFARLVEAGGHGFSAQNMVEHSSWWSRAEGAHVQVVGLDSCNHSQGSGGSLGPRQTAWLEAELQRCHSRWRGPSGGWVEASVSAISMLAAAGSARSADGAGGSWMKLFMMDSASQPGAGWRAPTSASSS